MCGVALSDQPNVYLHQYVILGHTAETSITEEIAHPTTLTLPIPQAKLWYGTTSFQIFNNQVTIYRHTDKHDF